MMRLPAIFAGGRVPIQRVQAMLGWGRACLAGPLVLLAAAWVLAGCRAEPASVPDVSTERPTLRAEGAPSATVATESIPVREVSFERRTLEVGEGPAATAAADLDQDGHLDLVVANELDGDLSIFLGDGLGGFEAQDRTPAGDNPTDLAMTDLDGDGLFDIVVANHDTDYLTLLLGDGSGGFRQASNSPLHIGVDPHPHVVRILDADLDGIDDLVVDHREGQGLLFLKGAGQGRFKTPGTLVAGGGDPYRGMAVGDINGDGFPDFATPNPAEVGILLSASAGPFNYTRGNAVPAAAPFAVELADFNDDGKLDLIAASDEGSRLIQIYLGDGQGRFEEAAYSPIEMAPGGKMIALGDFNGDGADDAAVISYQSSDLMLLLGGFEKIQKVMLPTVAHPWGLAAADLNGDGLDDLVVPDNTGKQAALHLSIADPGTR